MQIFSSLDKYSLDKLIDALSEFYFTMIQFSDGVNVLQPQASNALMRIQMNFVFS